MSRPPAGRAGPPVRLVHLFTAPQSLRFIGGLVDHALASGFEVRAIASPGPALERFGGEHRIPTEGIAMARRISPLADLAALGRLVRRLRALAPAIVHAHSPKAGLLGMLAATAVRVPVRVYQMRGLVSDTTPGARGSLLRAAERVSCRLAHRVVCQSRALRRSALDQRLGRPERLVVLENGSNGVDAVGRFDPARYAGRRAELRRRLGLDPDAAAVGFVGRLVGDKGIAELAEAWRMLKAKHRRARLVLVGPWERRDGVAPELVAQLEADDRVRIAGEVDDVAPVYAALDLVVLPTRREGFPNVPLEAAAMGLPVVASRIPACAEAVEDGVTGTLVPVGDPAALAGAIGGYLERPELAAAHGAAGRERVLARFRPEPIWRAQIELYRELLAERLPGAAEESA